MKRTVIYILGIWAGGFVIGMLLGRHYSPDPSKLSVALSYMELYSHWAPGSSADGTLSLRAPPYFYQWTGSGQVEFKPLPSAELISESPYPDWNENLRDLIEVAVAAPAGSLLKDLLTGSMMLNRLERWKLVVLGTVTLGGGILGYIVGHRAFPDTTDPRFIDSMKNSSLWEQTASDFHRFTHAFIGPCRSGGWMDEEDMGYRAIWPPRLRKIIMRLHPELIDEIVVECRASIRPEDRTAFEARLRQALVK